MVEIETMENEFRMHEKQYIGLLTEFDTTGGYKDFQSIKAAMAKCVSQTLSKCSNLQHK